MSRERKRERGREREIERGAIDMDVVVEFAELVGGLLSILESIIS